MAIYEVEIPEEEDVELQRILGKDGVPFAKRLYVAVRQAAAQKMFDEYVAAMQREHQQHLQTLDTQLQQVIQKRNAELIAKFRTHDEE